MRDKRNWVLAIIAGIEQLCHNNPITAQGRIFSPSGGFNRYVREYLESEDGITQKIRLRDIWDTDLGEEVRDQLKGARYLRNIVLYELDPIILDRISHQLNIQSPKLKIRKVRGRNRIVIVNHHPEPDSDQLATWPA